MPLYAIRCTDVEGSAELRQRHLAAHLAHVEANIAQYAVAGPLRQSDETVGSLLVIEARDAAEAKARIEADPYHAAGVWRDIAIEEFLAVAGDWVGGVTWRRD